MVLSAVNKKIAASFKGVAWLIAKLQEVAGDFFQNTLEENFRLAETIQELLEFVHGDRSRNRMNYTPIDIEVELINIRHNLWRHMLRQIIQTAKEGDCAKTELAEIWTVFTFAEKLNYGSIGFRDTGWNSQGLAEKAKRHLFPTLIKRLKTKLAGILTEKERDQYLLMLNGVKARYNWSTREYKAVDELIKHFDPEGKYKYKWV